MGGKKKTYQRASNATIYSIIDKSSAWLEEAKNLDKRSTVFKPMLNEILKLLHLSLINYLFFQIKFE